MSRKVLVVAASPRARGNSAALAEVAQEEILAAGAVPELLSLASAKIAPCTACDLCAAGKVRFCAIHDDMDQFYAKILEADAVLLVSPVYWFTYSAQLKLFIDRLYGLWNCEHGFLKGKAVGSVLVYGDVDVLASGGVNAVRTLSTMFDFLGARDLGAAYGTANDPGEAAANADLVGRVRHLARRLALD